tara:strand:+ start:269 stop:574 length:306 start_codon:yes stop_codon:yes gene_type:complete
MDISYWRKRIDIVDAQLVNLLADRSSCVIEIGKLKRQQELAVRDPHREERVIAQIVRNNQGSLENIALVRIFETIIDECVRLEEKVEQGHEPAGGSTPRSP